MKKNVTNSDSDYQVSNFAAGTCKKQEKNQGNKRKSQNSPRLNWSQEQNLSYYRFLDKNIQFFKCYRKRRQNKVFCLLGKKIKTRSINQIKSHHQKMLKRHKTIDSILKFLREKLYQVIYQKQQLSSQMRLKQQGILQKQTTQTFEESLESERRQLQLGIANNFPLQIPVQNDEWFGDV